jgi:hypothetical protein
MKNSVVLWDVTPYSSVKVYLYFGDTDCLCPQTKKSKPKKQPIECEHSEHSLRCRQYILSKRWHPSTKIYCVTLYKLILLILTPLRTSDGINFLYRLDRKSVNSCGFGFEYRFVTQ